MFKVSPPITKRDIGRKVHGLKKWNSVAVEAVIIDVNRFGCPCIARLRKDGTIREEHIWTVDWCSIQTVD